MKCFSLYCCLLGWSVAFRRPLNLAKAMLHSFYVFAEFVWLGLEIESYDTEFLAVIFFQIEL